MKKSAKLAIKERKNFYEVIGRGYKPKVRDRFELRSDNVRRRFDANDQAIRWMANVNIYAAGIELKSNFRETNLLPTQLR